MVIKVRAPRWYSWKNGVIEPCYELPKKSGSGMKAYSLREARELNLLPSVTSVLSVIDKPELDNWRVSQAIHSALTLPRLPDEGEDAFAERVLADAEAQANKAAEFGTRIHDAIAECMKARMEPGYHAQMKGEEYNFIQPFIVWADENIEQVHAVEQCVGHPSIGVAGRMDLDCTLKNVGRCIVDFKTQQVKDGKARFWDDWALQLAAYSELCFNSDRLPRHSVSIIIPSNEPGPVYPKVWNTYGSNYYLGLFDAALEIWIYTKGNGYDPRH